MEFWKIEGTSYLSDYKRSYVNGSIEHPYQLPGVVRCEVCRQYPGESCLLPYKCPATLRNRFSDPPVVTPKEFDRIAETVRAAVQKQGIDPKVVQPGCQLLPCFLDIPSKPTADFLWPDFSAIVSPRIRELFESFKITGVAFAEVTLRKVGKKSAKLSPPIPSTGEPEDIINEVATEPASKKLRYYELCVYSKSSPPPGRELLSVCPACGSKKFNWTRGQKLIMTESLWKGADIFFLETTGILLVTDTLKNHLERLRPANVEFTKFPTT